MTINGHLCDGIVRHDVGLLRDGSAQCTYQRLGRLGLLTPQELRREQRFASSARLCLKRIAVEDVEEATETDEDQEVEEMEMVAAVEDGMMQSGMTEATKTADCGCGWCS